MKSLVIVTNAAFLVFVVFQTLLKTYSEPSWDLYLVWAFIYFVAILNVVHTASAAPSTVSTTFQTLARRANKFSLPAKSLLIGLTTSVVFLYGAFEWFANCNGSECTRDWHRVALVTAVAVIAMYALLWGFSPKKAGD